MDWDQGNPSFDWRNVNSHFKQRLWINWGPLTPWVPWSVPSNPPMPSVVLQALSECACGLEHCFDMGVNAEARISGSR